MKTLVVKLFPPIRVAFDMAAMEQKYADRLTGLYEGNLDWMEREYLEHCKLKAMFNEPKVSRWKTFNAIAKIEATRDLLPSERPKIWAEVWFDDVELL
jgi:hypothetical protein